MVRISIIGTKEQPNHPENPGSVEDVELQGEEAHQEEAQGGDGDSPPGLFSR